MYPKHMNRRTTVLNRDNFVSREEPDVMFEENRTYDGASSVQISYRNDKKVN